MREGGEKGTNLYWAPTVYQAWYQIFSGLSNFKTVLQDSINLTLTDKIVGFKSEASFLFSQGTQLAST